MIDKQEKDGRMAAKTRARDAASAYDQEWAGRKVGITLADGSTTYDSAGAIVGTIYNATLHDERCHIKYTDGGVEYVCLPLVERIAGALLPDDRPGAIAATVGDTVGKASRKGKVRLFAVEND